MTFLEFHMSIEQCKEQWEDKKEVAEHNSGLNWALKSIEVLNLCLGKVKITLVIHFVSLDTKKQKILRVGSLKLRRDRETEKVVT